MLELLLPLAVIAIIVVIGIALRNWKSKFYAEMINAGVITRKPRESVLRRRYDRYSKRKILF